MTPSPRVLLAVAAGGAVGGLARFGLTRLAADGTGFPWTTFAINLSGSMLLAALLLLPLARRSPIWAAALGPGLLGGYTTFSATSEQTRDLLDRGCYGLATGYVVGTLAACLVAVNVVGRLAPPLPGEDEL
jgi:CrcB protein